MTTLMLCGGKLVSRHCSAPRTTRTLLLSHHQHYQQRQPTIVLLPSHQRWLSLTASRLDSNTTTDTDKVELFRPTEVLADNTAETVGSAARELVDLSAMGLGGYWPSGLVQSALELLYNHAHLPWWGSIVTLTFLLRLAMLPLMVKMQQVGAKIANLNKDAQVLHARIMDCKARGDKVGESQAGIEMVKLYQVHGVHPLQMLPLGFAQVPVFLSVLYGLKGMAALPVESLRSGGMLWFCDLVVPDPSFCLPLIACGSFLINIQLGGEGGATTDNTLSNRIRWIMSLGSICILPITITFPSAVLVYWVSNSMFSTLQILFFKNHSVKRLFGIPLLRKK